MPNLDTYGTRLYGAGFYGENTTTTQLWALEIDWDGNGLYDGTNEGLLMSNLTITRGRQHLLNSSNTGFEAVEVGNLTVELDNDDDRFNPLNTGSPLYPYVRPGMNVRLRTKQGSGGIAYSVFTGKIEDIQPVPGSKPKKVRITVAEGKKWLNDQEITIGLNSNIGIDEALTTILTEADYPFGWSIESTPDTIRWWWNEKVSAQQAIQDLIDVALGTFFIAADGTAKFYSRHHYSAPIESIDQADVSKDIQLRQPWEVIKNVISITGHPRIQQATADLWTLSDKPYIGPGKTIELWASFTDPATGLISPVATTDYLVNTASDGTGTNLTGSCTVAMVAFAESAKLTITNNSAQAGYITLLKVRGDAITAENPTRVEAVDADSRALFGPKKLNIDSPWLQDSNWINDLTNYLSRALTESIVFPKIQLVHRPDLQFAIDLFDVITLTSAKLGINGGYRVSYIEHRWNRDNGQEVNTVFNLEPTSLAAPVQWQFPTQIGISSIFGL